MKQQLHISGIEMFLRCGVQWEFRYVRGIKIPPPVAIHVGTATHKSVARNLEHKMLVNERLETDAVESVARDAFERSWERGVRLDEKEAKLGLQQVKGQSIDKAVRLSRLHHEELAPKLTPSHVERPWVLDVEGYDFQLAGTIDQQYHTKAIRDVKTKSRSPAQNETDKWMQGTIYSLAVLKHDGKIPEQLHLDSLVDTKTPKVVSQPSTRTHADFVPLLNIIATAHDAMSKGVFIPAAQMPSAWWCHPSRCGWHSLCPYTRNPVNVQIKKDLTPILHKSLQHVKKGQGT